MQLTTVNRLLSAALIAGTLFTAPAKAQSSALNQYKLLVDSTLVLGESTQAGSLRVLNNGPANAEVRWFDPKAGAWDTQVLEAGESLLGERGHVTQISKDTFVCLIGQAAGKDKAGYRNTSGYYSMPLVPTSENDKAQAKPSEKKGLGSTKGGAVSSSKSKPASKSKPETKGKPDVKTKGGESKSKPASKSKPEVKTKGGESKSKPASKSKP